MKLHLPLALFSALMCALCSTHTAQAVDIAPGATPINLGTILGTDVISLSGGTQTGAITGAGNLVISTGTVAINNSTGENTYTGDTIVKSGATLTMQNWTGASATEYKQFGTGTLVLSGTLNIKTGDKDPSKWLFKNNITLNDGATIQAGDNGITFGGNITLASGTAHMKMGWGNEWVFKGKKTGAGTISFEGDTNGETQLFILRGDNDTFTGTYKVNTAKSAIILENANSAKNAHINLDAVNSYLVLKNTDATIGGLTGSGTIRNGILTKGGTNSSTFTPGMEAKTLTVDQTNTGNDIFTGTIDNNVNLTKAGVGTLTLTNLTGYKGTLGLQSGTLSLKLGTGSTFDLAQVHATAGTLNLASGIFSISGSSIGTVSLGNAALTANGVTVLFDIIGEQSDKISFAGALSGTLNLDFNIVGASMGNSFTIMTTDSNVNASGSLSHLNGASQFYKGSFSASGNNILYTLSGYSDSLLQWNGGETGAWNTTNSSWKTNGASGVVFDSEKSVLFGDLADTSSATITLDGAGISTKGVLVESNETNYTLSGGKLTTDLFVKNGSSTTTLGLDYSIAKMQLNEGTLELLRTTDSAISVSGMGNLTINWGATNIGSMNLVEHLGALSIQNSGLRINTNALPGSSSITMNGSSLYLSDTGNITLSLTNGITVSGNDSKIIMDNTGNLNWNTALKGGGTLSVELSGNGNLYLLSEFANSNGTLTANSNILLENSFDLNANAGILLAEGKILHMQGRTLGGAGSLTLSKNTTVTFTRAQLNCNIILNALGGSVTFQDFQVSDDNTFGGKMTGSAGQVIFNHEGWGNGVIHNNWQGSDYVGTTIFKATGTGEGGKVRTHTYNVDPTASGNITPWGAAKNLVQIGSSDTKESLTIKFAGLGADNSATIANAIELITGAVANENSTLEFTSGTYTLSGNVKVINGGDNKAIIESSGADINLTGGLSGSGPLELNILAGKTLSLSGASDYTGTLTVTSGALSLGTDLSTGTVQLNASTTLNANGDGTVGTLILNGGNVSLSGTNNLSVKSITDNSAGKSTITVADTSSITFKETLAVNTKITGAGSVKINAGADKTVEITGTKNDYTGKTVISSGTAKAGNASAFGSSAISVSGGILNANNQALGNKVSIDSGSIVNLGTKETPKEINITAIAGKTVQIDQSFVSVANMSTEANQIIKLGNGTEMTVSGNSTFVISSANISESFATKGATVFSISGNSALVIGGEITLDFTSDAFNAWSATGLTLSINLFDKTQGSINLDALNKIIFKGIDGEDGYWTLTKDANASVFADLAANGSINVSFSGEPPVGPSIPGAAVPEPSSTGLALMGVAGLLLRRRRRA